MRRATALSAGPPCFFVSVASKGVKFTAEDHLCREERPDMKISSGAAARSVGLPPFFVNVASKGFKFTVGARLWRERRPVFECTSRAAAHTVGARHAVPVFPRELVPLVGAQFIAPLSPRPFPKRQCLMPTNLPQGAPKP
jgi:hypothetical protein